LGKLLDAELDVLHQRQLLLVSWPATAGHDIEERTLDAELDALRQG
jgi:hypothetical protein